MIFHEIAEEIIGFKVDEFDDKSYSEKQEFFDGNLIRQEKLFTLRKTEKNYIVLKMESV